MSKTFEEKAELRCEATKILWANGWTHEEIMAILGLKTYQQQRILGLSGVKK